LRYLLHVEVSLIWQAQEEHRQTLILPENFSDL
jgi:hypothetical protein